MNAEKKWDVGLAVGGFGVALATFIMAIVSLIHEILKVRGFPETTE